MSRALGGELHQRGSRLFHGLARLSFGITRVWRVQGLALQGSRDRAEQGSGSQQTLGSAQTGPPKVGARAAVSHECRHRPTPGPAWMELHPPRPPASTCPSGLACLAPRAVTPSAQREDTPPGLCRSEQRERRGSGTSQGKARGGTPKAGRKQRLRKDPRHPPLHRW